MNEDRTIAILRANCEPETPGDEHSEASAKLWRIMFGQYDALTARVAELEKENERLAALAVEPEEHCDEDGYAHCACIVDAHRKSDALPTVQECYYHQQIRAERDQLRARVVKLESDSEFIQAQNNRLSRDIAPAVARIDALTFERDRLREALEKIRDDGMVESPVADFARAALAPKEEKP